MRLARIIAPEAIMSDPFPGASKFIISPPESAKVGYIVWAVKAKTFDMTVTNSLASLDFASDHPSFRRGGSDGTFSGTFGA